ncbi:hypothetical protein [Ferrimonas sp. YFM]|uniref:hypothetical protein n=1 Tax=Ferrimonas sp. YFM TaxID=3028878 RepID=UPI0025723CFB|nr:hypothetical protein [Ferrimonas sp. YFM]BDY05969.1 hypothetical protein F0521_30100 [Ferrimonas sp. YFM]
MRNLAIAFLIAVTAITTYLYINNRPSSCLRDLEHHSIELAICNSLKVTSQDCKAEESRSVISGLECRKNGISEDQIFAAIDLGSRKAGDLPTSPYEKIKESLESSPYHLKPTEANFTSFSSRCLAYGGQLHRIFGYHVKNGHAEFIAIELDSPCLGLELIDKKFPVITSDQLEELSLKSQKQGWYPAKYKKVTIHQVRTLDEATSIYKEMEARATSMK